MARRSAAPDEPVRAEAMRDAVEAMIEDGAVAMLVITENAKGEITQRVVPNLHSVRLSLIVCVSTAEPDAG